MTSTLRENRQEQGFTLIELLVVVLVIGILAAVAVPTFLTQRQKANDATVESDINSVAKEIETLLIGSPNPGSISVKSYKGGGTTPLVASIGMVSATPSSNYASVTVGEQNTNVILSDGVVVEGEGNAQGYILRAAHKNGSEYSYTGGVEDSKWLVYDSNQGGLQVETLAVEGQSERDKQMLECKTVYTQTCADIDLQAFDEFVNSWIAANDSAKVTQDASMSSKGLVSFTTNGGRTSVGRANWELPTGTPVSSIRYEFSGEMIIMIDAGGKWWYYSTKVMTNYPEAIAKQEADAFTAWLKTNMPADATSAKYEHSRKTVTFRGGKTTVTMPYTGFTHSSSAIRDSTYSPSTNSVTTWFAGTSARGISYPMTSYTFRY